MSNFIICDATTGEVIRAGNAPPEMITIQANDGEISIAVPDGVIAWPELNLEPLRQFYLSAVDLQAGQICAQFITIAPAQELRYMEKRREAKAWTEESDPADFPFLNAEATATGQSIAAIAATVLGQTALWRAVGSRIEGARIGAKKQINEATTILTIVKAGTVDWNAVISDL